MKTTIKIQESTMNEVNELAAEKIAQAYLGTMDIEGVAKYYNFSRRQAVDLVKSKGFPSPIFKRGHRRWRFKDVLEFQES